MSWTGQFRDAGAGSRIVVCQLGPPLVGCCRHNGGAQSLFADGRAWLLLGRGSLPLAMERVGPDIRSHLHDRHHVDDEGNAIYTSGHEECHTSSLCPLPPTQENPWLSVGDEAASCT